MEGVVRILRDKWDVEDELLVYQTNGDRRELPDRILELLTDEEIDEFEGGEWITVVDGEVVRTGEFHPFHIHVSSDE